MEHKVIARIEADMKAAGLGWWPRSGLDFEVEERRYYPRGSLAAQVIGFTNIDGVGQYGIEAKFDEMLRSVEVTRETVRDGKGRAIDPVAVAAEDPTISNSIVLTLDERIQFILEKELAAQVEQYNAAGAIGIVMRPKTGEVLAMANHPTFDLNEYNNPNVNAEVRRNLAVWWPYEPGSVFKALTLAALVDSGRVSLSEQVYCENGLYSPAPKIKPIRDAHKFGTLTFAEVIQQSSNIGTLKLASKYFTQEEYRGYVERFGLMQTTGIDLPYERRGDLRALSDRAGYAIYYAPWGQGISVTPLQVLSVMNTIANGGVVMRPFIVKAVLDPHGAVKEETQPTVVGRAISEQAARTSADVLEGVLERGSAMSAKIEGVRIAGKTGTSQKAADESRGYERGAYVSSFAGFFPIDDPQYSMVIIVDKPQGQNYGGVVAAPVFKRVAEQLLKYEKINAVMAASESVEEPPYVAEGREQ